MFRDGEVVAPKAMPYQGLLCTVILTRPIPIKIFPLPPPMILTPPTIYAAPQNIFLNIPRQTVDRIGRTARRSVDTHIRNIFSQPRICTSLRRISALFAFGVSPRMSL